MNYRKKTLLLILIATLVRCITAATIELGNDEVYYRFYAQDLHWNYFDHPPMVGWLIRFTTANLFLDTDLFIRLGAILSAAAATWLLFLSGKKLRDEQTGFLAAVIYTATIYGSIIAGTFILPDSPQMVCWTGCLYLLITITEHTNISTDSKRAVLWFGVVAGLGMLCKIHTSFLWLGFLLYILLYNKKWLKEPFLYISGIITLLMFYPVIQWNINNHFVTYLYHSKRVNVAEGGFDIGSLLTFSAGQVFYTNPVLFPFFIVAAIGAFKNRLPFSASHKNILLLTSLPLIVIALAISLFKNVLPHWTGPAYSGLVLLTAGYFSKLSAANIYKRNWLPGALKAAIVFIVTIVFAGILVINFYPGTMGKKDKNFLGEGDFTLDMYGWADIKPAFEQIVKRDVSAGIMKLDAVIVSNKWFPASHIDFYVALPLKKDLIAIGDTSDIHQYAWLNTTRKMLHHGDDAYLIIPSEDYSVVKDVFSASFEKRLAPEMIEQKRSGKVCRLIYVYKLKNYLGK